jgi:hypothetical protein
MFQEPSVQEEMPSKVQESAPPSNYIKKFSKKMIDSAVCKFKKNDGKQQNNSIQTLRRVKQKA